MKLIIRKKQVNENFDNLRQKIKNTLAVRKNPKLSSSGEEAVEANMQAIIKRAETLEKDPLRALINRIKLLTPNKIKTDQYINGLGIRKNITDIIGYKDIEGESNKQGIIDALEKILATK